MKYRTKLFAKKIPLLQSAKLQKSEILILNFFYLTLLLWGGWWGLGGWWSS